MKFTVVFESLDDMVIGDMEDFSMWLDACMGKSILVKILSVDPDDITATDYELESRSDEDDPSFDPERALED